MGRQIQLGRDRNHSVMIAQNLDGRPCYRALDGQSPTDRICAKRIERGDTAVIKSVSRIDLCLRFFALPPLVSFIFAKTFPTAVANAVSSPMPPMCMNITLGESQMK